MRFPIPESLPNTVRTLHSMEGLRKEDSFLCSRSVVGIVRALSLRYYRMAQLEPSSVVFGGVRWY